MKLLSYEKKDERSRSLWCLNLLMVCSSVQHCVGNGCSTVWREMAGKHAPHRVTAGKSCGVSGELQETLEEQAETMLQDRWEWATPIHTLKSRNIVPRGEPELGGGNQCQSFCFSNGSRGRMGCRELLGGRSNTPGNMDTPLLAVCWTGTHLWLHLCYETKLQQH